MAKAYWKYLEADWFVSFWHHSLVVSHCFRRDSTDVQKVKKYRASLTENESEVSTESLWDQQKLYYPSDPIYKGKKSKDALLQIAERLVSAARWTHFTHIKNLIDWRLLHELGLHLIGEATLRTVLMFISCCLPHVLQTCVCLKFTGQSRIHTREHLYWFENKSKDCWVSVSLQQAYWSRVYAGPDFHW